MTAAADRTLQVRTGASDKARHFQSPDAAAQSATAVKKGHQTIIG